MNHLVTSLLTLITVLTVQAQAAESASGPAKAPRPNIVFILADDLGLDGVGCYGSDKHKTPNVDRLANAGLRFQTAYSAPLCGPTRCLLMTGRYAFRTGGLQNSSWRPGGPGAVSSNEHPMPRLLKEAGYATGMCGKWRQVGETPSDWGFQEYITDPRAGGWFWESQYEENGKQVTKPEGAYSGEVYHQFAVDFMRRHKEGPFFFYYSMHHVHAPILKTPDSEKEAAGNHYEDNIRYMDKQVGAVVAELERLGIRTNTLVLFAADNGTAPMWPSTIGGRMLNGHKGSLLEGGARVPFIASWPGTTPAGKVCKDLIDFSDPLATFVELAGAKLPQNFKYDGHSFAPQLRGEKGHPREWAYVQLGNQWYVREAGFKLNEKGDLFDMSDAPFVEKPVSTSSDTDASKAARARLTAALKELNPSGGKVVPAGAEGTAAKKGGKKKKKTAAPGE